MRLVRTSFGGAALCMLLWGFPALAQEDRPTAFVTAACEGDSMNLGLWVVDRGGHPEVIGFDVYRRALGQCGSLERRNAVILPRLVGVDFSDRFVDREVEDGVAYEYLIVGVDADRNPINPYLVYSAPGTNFEIYPDCALGPVIHGTVWQFQFQGWLTVIPCPGSCYVQRELLVFEGSEMLEPYIGTGTAVLISGSAGCSAIEGCAVTPGAVVPLPCTTAVERRTWGNVKSLYRR